MNIERVTCTRLRRRHEAARGACCAIGVIMGVVQGGACLFDVRARIRSLAAFDKRRKGKKYLREREEENRRSPEGARKQA